MLRTFQRSNLFPFLMAGFVAFLPAGVAPQAAAASRTAGSPIRIALIEGLSGPFANAGEAAARNLQTAIERVNARGGVRLPEGARKFELVPFDNQQTTEQALTAFGQLTDQRIRFVVQGNSSTVASALVEAVGKHNEKEPANRVLFLNHSAADPVLTNEQCSFWHFRFDAHSDMRMNALTDLMRDTAEIRKVYLIGQDYSFGRQFARSARTQLAAKRATIEIVGDDLHPVGQVSDFTSYIEKIRASGADSVLTGNYGNDLALLVKAAREAAVDLRFYTFYGSRLGTPAAIGDAGVDRVRAVAEWHPNVGGSVKNRSSDIFYQAYRQRFPAPREDTVHLRMHVMIEMLAAAIEKARTTEAAAVARALEGATFQSGFHHATMRASDHQLLQPLYVTVMQKAGTPGIRFDNEGSGYGFRTERYIAEAATALVPACAMTRPAPDSNR